MPLTAFFAVVFFGLSFSQCWGAEAPLPVVASFSILADITKEVGGDLVDVKALVGPDSDTHSYDPTPQDALIVSHSKILVINGLGFEGWLPRLASASDFKGIIVTASEGIQPRLTKPIAEDEGSSLQNPVVDPHAWQNAKNGIIYAQNIARALQSVLPDKRDEIQKREDAYEQKLKALNDSTRAELDTIPKNKRVIITNHDAFGYFGEAYNIKIISPIGLSTESEPTIRELAALIGQIEALGVTTIFLENMTGNQFAKTLALDSKAVVGPKLYADALSNSEGPAPTYISMFNYNVTQMKKAMIGAHN